MTSLRSPFIGISNSCTRISMVTATEGQKGRREKDKIYMLIVVVFKASPKLVFLYGRKTCYCFPSDMYVLCLQKEVLNVFYIVWQFFEPLLFGLIGAAVDLRFISPSLVGKG